MITKPPIFIMSSERSGSNLLRLLLGNHSRIASPVAVHLLNSMAPLAGYYAPLSDEKHAAAYYDLLVQHVNQEYYDWKFTTPFAEMRAHGRHDSFSDFFRFFYETKGAADAPEKTRLVFKENAIFDYAFELLHHFPDARFLYLYRDPRDYVASWMKVPRGFSTPQKAIKNWVEEQTTCELATAVFGLPCHRVKYEDLITDPVTSMNEILDFVGEEREVACYSTDREKNSSYVWNEYWKNLDKPIMSDNKNKFLTELDQVTIREIEQLAGEHMLKLGYDMVTTGVDKESNGVIHKVFRKLRVKAMKKQAGSRVFEETEARIIVKNQIATQLLAQARAFFLHNRVSAG